LKLPRPRRSHRAKASFERLRRGGTLVAYELRGACGTSLHRPNL
jgi:hypothetical protein